MYSIGSDKVNTLTHCRFEAKAIFGIENMIVADFDEFLYCPIVPPTASAQSRYIHTVIQDNINSKYEQLTFPQYVVANKTSSTRDCLIDHVKTGKSIFTCFASFQYPGNDYIIWRLLFD